MNLPRNEETESTPREKNEGDNHTEASPFSLSADALVTPILVAFNLAVFFGMMAGGMPLQGSPPIEIFVAWGANFGPLTLAGEWWRLIACTFIHESLFHLVPNLLGLWVAGSLLERRIGSANFLAIYLVSALGGSLASLAWNSGTVAFGASGAVMGVLGALAVLSYRSPSFIRPAPAISPFVIAVVILAVTALLGSLAPSVDHAGHLGGLASGCALAAALNTFPGSSTTQRTGLRALGVSAGCLVILGLIAANLPRHVIVVENEFQRFAAIQNHLTNQVNLAQDQPSGERLDLSEFRDFLADEILPLSRNARQRIAVLEYVPPAYERHRKRVLERALARERRLETYIEEATRVEAVVSRLNLLEREIGEHYERIQEEFENNSLSAQEIAERLFSSTVDPWEPLIADMHDDEGLSEGLRERLGVLQTYAALRKRAWELSAQSIREGSPELAMAAQEEHAKAHELIAPWIAE